MLRVIHEQMEKGRNSEREICHKNEKAKQTHLATKGSVLYKLDEMKLF